MRRITHRSTHRFASHRTHRTHRIKNATNAYLENLPASISSCTVGATGRCPANYLHLLFVLFCIIFSHVAYSQDFSSISIKLRVATTILNTPYFYYILILSDILPRNKIKINTTCFMLVISDK